MKKLTVYSIHDFRSGTSAEKVYVNRLKEHVKEHAFTNLPHKHDFYLCMVVTRGSGTHEIDFKTYRVQPGRVFLMQPGQMHFWKLSADIDGFIFFHSREFYEEGYTHSRIRQFPFFRSFQSGPLVQLDARSLRALGDYGAVLLKEYGSGLPLSMEKMHSLINAIYIDLLRCYSGSRLGQNSRYLETFSVFEEMVETGYRSQTLPKYYAARLNISEKHLNRICRACVNKTSTQVIAERILLEAKRLLSQVRKNVTEVGSELGFSDPSYFVRFFRKHAGVTPLQFQKKYFL